MTVALSDCNSDIDSGRDIDIDSDGDSDMDSDGDSDIDMDSNGDSTALIFFSDSAL